MLPLERVVLLPYSLNRGSNGIRAAFSVLDPGEKAGT